MTHQAKAPSAGSSKRQGRRLGRIFRGAFATRASFRTSKGSGAPSARRPKLLLGLAAAIAATLILGVSLAVAAAPTVSVEPATSVAFTTAKVKGEVDSQELPTTWRFQYITDVQLEANEKAEPPLPPFEGATDGPGGTIEAGSGADTLSRKLTGLTPHTTYHLRLLAENGDGQDEAVASSTFKTNAVAPPAASSVEVPPAALKYTEARAHGTVELANADPAFNATTCRFEYATQADWEANGNAFPEPEGAPSMPCDAEPADAGEHEVEAQLSGLRPGTEYHLRLVAANLGGSANAEGPTFITETVTPPALEIDQVTTFTASSAHLSGHVDPGGTDPAFDAHWRFECEPACPGLQGGTVAGTEGQQAVEEDPSGLEPNTTYTVKLIAENLGGSAEAAESGGAPVSFHTPSLAPGVATGTNTPDPEGDDHAVTVRGYVNPRNSEITKCEFRFGLTTAYGQSAPCDGADEVQAVRIYAIAGQFRLTFEGQTTPDIDFDSSPESIQAKLEALPSVGAGNVKVRGGTGNEKGAIPYAIPYVVSFTGSLAQRDVPQLSLEDGTVALSGGSEASAVNTTTPGALPLGQSNAYSGNEPQETTIHPSGLQADAVYHFAVLATSAAGTEESGDSTFTIPTEESSETCPNEARRSEQHSTYLPDCRAYELASPSNKNGGDVMPYAARTRAAADGGAVGFTSLTGFADVHGTGVSTEYMSVRDAAAGTQGWGTHAITPPQQPLTLFGAGFGGLDPTYDGEFSSDLSRGIIRTASPLTDDPNVQKVINFYVRNDLRSPGAGTYQLVTPCPGCSEPLPSIPFIVIRPTLAGASADFTHVLLESSIQLTGDAPEGSNLYEWQDGALRLAGILPASACGSPPCIAAGSMAGQGAANGVYTPHTISADGSRIFFTAGGNLYMRVDNGLPDAHTIQLNASERTPADSPGGARFEDATPDGLRVFFTSSESLTDDVNPGGAQLYMYDVTPDPQGHHLTLLSVDREPADDAITSDGVKGVIGASADGRYVYFTAASGQLVPGAPTPPSGPLPGEDKIYLWHDGTVSYVGATPAENEELNLNPKWALIPKQARVTPDGGHMLFLSMSGAGLTGYDHGSCPGNNTASHRCQELYVYGAEDGRLSCASCNPAGTPASADASDFSAALTSGAGSTWHLPQALSGDGRFAFFSTAEALVPRDTNGKVDAYEYDVRGARVRLLSSGTDPSSSYFLEASASGRDVFIATRQRSAGWDGDGNYDLYDARIGGGFPEPPPAPAPCASGDTCKDPVQTQPSPAGPASIGAKGPGNRPGSHGCPRGRVRRHGKCVKTHKAKKHTKKSKSKTHRAGPGHGGSR